MLKSVFGPAHLLVTLDIFANPESFDYSRLGKASDLAIVMLYDQHVQSGIPGPIASQQWLDRVAGDIFAKIPPSKVILGLGNYGYDWPVNTDGKGNVVRNRFGDPIVVGPGRKVLLGDALECAIASGARAGMDSGDLNPYFLYSDPDHKDRLIYVLDAATAYNQVMALARYKPRGAALWYLGSEDPSIWSFFAAGKLGKSAHPSDFEELAPCPRMIHGTKGPVPKYRKVEIGEDGLVRSETYSN